MLVSSLFLILPLVVAQSLACRNSLQAVENLEFIPAPWVQSRPASADHSFQISIALQRNQHIEETLYNISTPGHSQYGKHLTRLEAQTLLSPDVDSHSSIMEWLKQSSISTEHIKNDAHWIRFNTTVETANKMLDAHFTWYKHPQSKMEVLRTMRYSVPTALHSRISLVYPTTRFCSHPMMHNKKDSSMEHIEELRKHRRAISDDRKISALESRATGSVVDPSCNRTVTPTCLRALYNVPANLTVSNARGVGVYASQNQVAKFNDFNLFLQKVAPEAKGVSLEQDLEST